MAHRKNFPGLPVAGLTAAAILSLWILLSWSRASDIDKSSARSWIEQSDNNYQQWLSTYVAADPSYQDYCTEVLRSNARFKDKGAQYSQDIFLFNNLFREWPALGRKGFYVESGANDPLQISSSLFFDKCLGWSGLCIEPQPQYHQAIKDKRSCTLVPECISPRKEHMKMSASGAASAVVAAGSVTVQCAPLADILDRYTDGTQKRIDLWILDVEGFELQVLQGHNFDKTQVDVMLIESFWLPPAPNALDIMMGKNNFIKYQELAIDSVFVRRGTPAALSNSKVWFPPLFDDDVQANADYAKMADTQKLLKHAWGMEA